MVNDMEVRARVPKALHRAARITSVMVEKPMSEVIREALSAWVADEGVVTADGDADEDAYAGGK